MRGLGFVLKKALLSALVALVLFSLMIGIRTEAGPTGQLIYWTRFGELASIVAIVFAGSIIIELVRQWLGPAGAGQFVPAPVQNGLAAAGRYVAPALLIFTLLVPVIFYNQRYIIDLGILVLTYVMLGWGLNVVVGLAGLLDLGYVAFYAVGAYSYALLATTFGLSFWTCLPLAGFLASLWGVMLGFPVLRLRGDYLAIVTLGFGEIIRLLMNNLVPVTNGPQGISRIDQPFLFGFALRTPRDFFLLLLPLAILALTLAWRLECSILGLGWAAIREDQDAARGFGINTTLVKLLAFGLSATLGGFAGVVFAGFQRFVDPVSFSFWESLTIVLIIVVGGVGNVVGVVVGAVVLIVVPELLREYAEYRMLLYGCALVVMILARPGGIVGRRYNPAWVIQKLGWR